MISTIKQKFSINNADTLALGVLTVLVVVIFGYALRRVVLGYDYDDHIAWAQEMAESGAIPIPHFLYQLLTVIVRLLIPLPNFVINGATITPFILAGLAVALAFYWLLGVILYFLIRDSTGREPSRVTHPICVLGAISLIVVAPVNLPTFPSHNLYFGYIGINVYHNPTMVLLKPLALLLFLHVYRSISTNLDSVRSTLTALFLLATSTLAKPSFTLVLLPLIAIWVGYRFWRKEPLAWRFLIWGICMPAFFLVAWQYYHRYIIDVLGASRSIGIAPLAVMAAHQATKGFAEWVLVPKFVLSILFPLVFHMCYPKESYADSRLSLAWGAFGIGAFYGLFFAEFERATGKVNLDGNFLWSAQIALFILFVMSAQAFVRRVKANTASSRGPWWRALDWRALLCIIAFSLHLVSGIIWYGILLQNGSPSWW